MSQSGIRAAFATSGCIQLVAVRFTNFRKCITSAFAFTYQQGESQRPPIGLLFQHLKSPCHVPHFSKTTPHTQRHSCVGRNPVHLYEGAPLGWGGDGQLVPTSPHTPLPRNTNIPKMSFRFEPKEQKQSGQGGDGSDRKKHHPAKLRCEIAGTRRKRRAPKGGECGKEGILGRRVAGIAAKR